MLTHVASAMGRLQGGQRSFCDGLLGVSPTAIVVDNAVALEASAAASIQAACCHPLCLPRCTTAVVAQ